MAVSNLKGFEDGFFGELRWSVIQIVSRTSVVESVIREISTLCKPAGRVFVSGEEWA